MLGSFPVDTFGFEARSTQPRTGLMCEYGVRIDSTYKSEPWEFGVEEWPGSGASRVPAWARCSQHQPGVTLFCAAEPASTSLVFGLCLPAV